MSEKYEGLTRITVDLLKARNNNYNSNNNKQLLLQRLSNCIKLKENKIVSGFSQTQQHIFIVYYLDKCFSQFTITGHLYKTQNKVQVV